jgi:hypothetical protein
MTVEQDRPISATTEPRDAGPWRWVDQAGRHAGYVGNILQSDPIEQKGARSLPPGAARMAHRFWRGRELFADGAQGDRRGVERFDFVASPRRQRALRQPRGARA